MSFDAGQAFFPSNTHRITDEQLRLAGEPDQITVEVMPTIRIDRDGGVNLMVARAIQASSPTIVTIRYARFNSVADLGGAPLFVQDLTPPFQLSSLLGLGQGGNDYQMLATADCSLYAVYARVGPDASGNDTVNV